MYQYSVILGNVLHYRNSGLSISVSTDYLVEYFSVNRYWVEYTSIEADTGFSVPVSRDIGLSD